ncbi:MAG: hypothetical protein NTW68_15505, partial [candidate division NC10 bacterium]|nr:hypothetical protein [candidate division NC10 bacterium]
AAIQSETRDNPPRQNLGGITVVGSDSNRFNCAWTDKYFVFGTRPCVALVAETFLGKHRSVAKAPPGDGLFLTPAPRSAGEAGAPRRRPVESTSSSSRRPQRRTSSGPGARPVHPRPAQQPAASEGEAKKKRRRSRKPKAAAGSASRPAGEV